MNIIKTFTLAIVLATSLQSKAQVLADGYYRVQNTVTQRYISIIDSTSNTQMQTTTPDIGALVSVREATSDPSTIIYVQYAGTNSEGEYYNLVGQGINVYSMTGYMIYLALYAENEAYNTYRAWAVAKGMRFWLEDEVDSQQYDEGIMATNSNSTMRFWNAIPVSSETDNYFGIAPDINIGSKYYTTLYAGFPFKAVSEGLRFYYIDSVEDGKAYYKEITGTVPQSTPVIVECASADPANNKVEVIYDTQKAPSENQLGGFYFHSNRAAHICRFAYDAETMRVLGELSDGSIGFVQKSSSDFDRGAIPANSAYLKVASGTAAELTFVESGSAGINDIKAESTKSNIYTLTGTKVRSNTTSTEGLNSGVYIIGNKKVVVK